MNKINVMHIIPSCQRGGVPTIVHGLIDAIDKKRFEVCLVAPNDGPFHDRFARLCPVYDIPIRGCYPSTLIKLRQLMKENSIDIVHAHGKGAGLYGRMASIGTRTKTIYSLHGFDYAHFGPLIGRTYLLTEKLLEYVTDQVVAVSCGEEEKARKAGLLSKTKCVVISNGIAFENKNSKRDNARTIGTLSRSCYAKGLDILIETVALLGEKYPDLLCYVAGGTPKGEEGYEARLKAKVRELNVDNRVVFLGEISDIDSFFSSISIYVSTSRWEGMPTAILEAFASRTPVVATDVVGNRDLVRNLKTGILVRSEDSEAMAAGIAHALENPDEMKLLASNAHQYGSENFSVEKTVANHEALYESLVAR